MHKFLKNTVRDINSVKKFIDAGLDIPDLKNKRSQLNKEYEEIVKEHEKYKNFASEIIELKAMLETQTQFRLKLVEKSKSDSENLEIYTPLISEIEKSTEAIVTSLNLISVGMNDEQFEKETIIYNERLTKINNDLSKARNTIK